MRILIITTFLPYPITAGGIQAQFNIINQLRSRHEVALLFPMSRDNKPEAMRALQLIWPEVKMYPFGYLQQMLSPTFVFSKIRKAINRHLNPDKQNKNIRIALEDYLFPASYRYKTFLKDTIDSFQPNFIEVDFYQNINIGKYLPSNIKKVFIHHELRFVIIDRLTSSLPLNNKQKLRKEQLKSQEIGNLNFFDAVITLTDTDKHQLIDAGVTVPVYSAPAAVSTELMPYKKWNNRLVFIGGYGHAPNPEGIDWFLNEVVPKVEWSRWPETELLIIGKGWPEFYQGTHNNLPVRCLGFVEDLKEYVHGSIVIVPVLTGSGMRMKILDAAALSCPFISTHVGAEGLLFDNNTSCILAESSNDFAHGLERLFTDESLRQNLANNAHALFERYYSVDALSLLRESIFEKIAKDN